MPTKKTTAKKVSATKKPAPARKSTAKASKKLSTPSRQSLASRVGLRKEETPFFTFKVTKESLYWIVLGLVVILFTAWLMKLQMDIETVYDQVDANTMRLAE